MEDGLYRQLELIDGASEALNKLSDDGAHIRVVTHRLLSCGLHQKVVSDTALWLDEKKIPYMSLCFTGLKDSVHADVYIEDDPAAVGVLSDRGIPTIVFAQSYNTETSGKYRAENWEEAYNCAEQILQL